MKNPATKLRLVVPADDRLKARDDARQKLETELSGLSLKRKDVMRANELLGVLKAYLEQPKDESVREKAVKVVSQRIRQLKRLERLDEMQTRELKLVIYFTNGRTGLDDQRTDACAILKLYGSEKSIDDVCALYPGLSKLFE